ncbi:MAG: outer membrane lipoprotein-sorting protein [Candidatus Rokuibacteriota bacterium]
MSLARLRPRASTVWIPLALALTALAPARGEAQSGPEIMQRHRQLHRLKDEEERLRLRLVSKHGDVKERRVVRWTMTGAGGLDKILLRFLAPRDVENTGLLTWEARDGDDDQWLYLPATKKSKRIAASGKKNRFMGTDFTYEDLRAENTAVHAYTLAGEETVEGRACWLIESAPANEREAAATGYSKRRLWVRKDNYTLVKREYHDKRGRLEKIEGLHGHVKVAATAWRATEIVMQDVQNGTKTQLIVEERAVDRGLRDDFFSEAELTRVGS